MRRNSLFHTQSPDQRIADSLEVNETFCLISDYGIAGKGGRPMVAGEPAAIRLMGSLDNRITGEPKPTRKQVAMVLHALADHTAIMQMVNYDMRDLHDQNKKTEYWPTETSIGRWFHAVGQELEDRDA